jgi:cysteine desulfurase/selenocysteine lyase
VAVEVLALGAQALDRGAALVVAPHVSPVDGSILPVADLAAVAHDAGAWLAVDGTLAAGAFAVDVPVLGADVYVAAGDRWLLGPSGVAAVYLGPDVPVAGGLTGPEGLASPLELNRAAVVGLGRSAGWLAMQVGLEWAFARARRLTQALGARLASIRGVALLAPPAAVATVLCLRLEGWPAEALREQLGRRAFAIVGLGGGGEAADTGGSGGAIRIGLGCWNTDDELDRFAAAVEELAVTTPEEAARWRPPIVVVPGGAS